MAIRRTFLASVALVLLMSGCSDDSATTTTGAGPTTTAATTTASTNPPTTVASTRPDPEPTPTTAVPATTPPPRPIPPDHLEIAVFPVPAGSRPHDVAPAPDGTVWYTAQNAAALGSLDPATGATRHIPLGAASRPHGVIVGPGGDAWVTDGGLNAIVRVDGATDEVEVFPLPSDRPDANLNTAAFAGDGRLWFTGQNGVVGVLDPATGEMQVFDAPRGRGPYGITATPGGDIYFASLAGSYVGAVAPDGTITVLEPPTPDQGARRVWSDSEGRIWVSEWNVGRLGRYDPGIGEWAEWPLPGDAPSAYAVFVDDTDIVWVSDFGGNAVHRFGRPGEVWAPESAADQLIVIRRVPD